jgi:hypothetical protein
LMQKNDLTIFLFLILNTLKAKQGTLSMCESGSGIRPMLIWRGAYLCSLMANQTLANVALPTPVLQIPVAWFFSGTDQTRPRFSTQNERIPMGSFWLHSCRTLLCPNATIHGARDSAAIRHRKRGIQKTKQHSAQGNSAIHSKPLTGLESRRVVHHRQTDRQSGDGWGLISRVQPLLQSLTRSFFFTTKINKEMRTHHSK